MIMHSTNVDYFPTCFKDPTLTKFYDKPTYKTLLELKNQLKTNDSTVTSDLWGGANDYLGLVCEIIEYENVNPIRYINPTHPGPLEIEENLEQHKAIRMHEMYKEDIQTFREMIDIQKKT